MQLLAVQYHGASETIDFEITEIQILLSTILILRSLLNRLQKYILNEIKMDC